MSNLTTGLLTYLLNSVWQLPLLFAAAWLAARLVRPLGPRIEHRVWVSALIAQILLPAFALDFASLVFIRLAQRFRSLLAILFGSEHTAGHVQIFFGPATTHSPGFFHLPSALLTTLLAAWACSLVYFVARLAWGLWKTCRLSMESHPISEDATLNAKLEILSSSIDPLLFKVAISPAVSSPVTIGLRRHTLLIPPGFLDQLAPADLDALLAHEIAHMRRCDFAKNLLYSIFSLPIAWHPVLWLTRTRLAESREMACDEMAAETLRSRESYARSLLHLASLLTGHAPVQPLHAIGIFDANIFERRVMNLTQTRPSISTSRRFIIATATILVACAACASATVLRMEVTPPQASPDHGPTQNPKSIHVKYDHLKLITQVPPVYPPRAKATGISGTVTLDATISKDGVPMALKIVEGHRELQESALDAVRQWRWEPYLLNGEPIEVQTTVTVVFSLGN